MSYPLLHPRSARPHPLSLSVADFAAEFPSESDHVEFKSGVSTKELQNTAVAFSNADGGVILIGVADDGEVRGRALDSGTQDDIHRSLHDARDIGRYGVSQVDVAGRPVVVVAVDRRREGFAQTSQGVVRVRRGTRDDVLFGVELVRFANERTASRYETTPLPVSIGDADPGLLDALADTLSWRAPTVELLEAAELAEGGRLTVAGALYALPDPAAVLGKALVEVLRYPDDQTIDYDAREEMRGPLPALLTGALSAVQKHLGTELVVLGARRYDLPRLPEIVLRETIANALAHRSYEASGTAVRIELRPSAVIVRSPGGLPEPVTVENIREASAARNVAAIRVLRAFGLAEDAGRGVDLIQDRMADEMLDPPRFADRGHEVVVTLPVRSTVAPVERAWLRELQHRGALRAPDRIVLLHAARGEELTNGRVRELLAVDREVARDALRRLRDAGFLEQRGERGGATYRLSGSLTPPAGLRLTAEELEDVVRRLAAEGPITNGDVRAATGLDRVEARLLLDRLVRADVIERVGERRGTRYLLRTR